MAFANRRVRAGAAGSCIAVGLIVAACRPAPVAHDGTSSPDRSSSGSASASASASYPGSAGGLGLDASALGLDAAVALGDGGPPTYSDPMSLHQETREGLLSLFSIKELTPEQNKVVQADSFLRAMFNPSGPSHANQGNKEIALHTTSREKCLEGLKDMVIQTPEQKAKCGADNMVPVWSKGKDPWFCIDVFEFPNKPCELPMVWTQPPLAKKVCELQGKRLCSDIEWNLACKGDPEGGDDWRYAYGNKLDLEICNTNLRHRTACTVKDAPTTWKTCSTDTEPSGAFPKCRSRFGVFDQHGNVAEVMMRREGDKVFTQLKGSAWFYVELAKEPNEPVPESTTNKSGAYPDHCNFDPRWHVEQLDQAMHVNYHLGFRCCKSIP
jgi:hypothetical protein